MLHSTHEQKVQGVRLIGVANKNAVLRHLWALPNDLKYNGVNFFDNFDSTVVLMSRSGPEISRSGDFCANRQTDRQRRREPTAYPLLHMHVRNNDLSTFRLTCMCTSVHTKINT